MGHLSLLFTFNMDKCPIFVIEIKIETTFTIEKVGSDSQI
jgi:hypothetical protein